MSFLMNCYWLLLVIQNIKEHVVTELQEVKLQTEIYFQKGGMGNSIRKYPGLPATPADSYKMKQTSEDMCGQVSKRVSFLTPYHAENLCIFHTFVCNNCCYLLFQFLKLQSLKNSFP